MRVVIYNFVQSDDRNKQKSGGVAIYQGNLIKALKEAGHNVIALSSGDRYDLVESKPRLQTYVDAYDRAIIVNSPMLAPAHDAFQRLEVYTESSTLDPLAGEFRAIYGDIDVFHFQNIEGLTLGFIRALRREYPNSSFLLSLHNYNFVCPQVNLWYREFKACEDYHEGKACVNCVIPLSHSTTMKRRRLDNVFRVLGIKKGARIEVEIERWAKFALQLINKTRSSSLKRADGSSTVLMSSDLSEKYRRFRESNIELAATIFDKLLAVSERTRQVLIARGVPSEKLSVSYIGTAHFEKFETATKIQNADHHIHLAFLGYMRSDKGFYFLLDALFSLHESVAKNVSLTIAAPITDSSALDRLRGMAYRFKALHIYNGYSHSNLDKILESVNLGVIPVLWEDNLPQVAIELVARGVPILTSNRGGAQEIASAPEFIFEAGSRSDLCEKLNDFVSGRVPLGSFWKNQPRIYSMTNHVADITQHYNAVYERPSNELA